MSTIRIKSDSLAFLTYDNDFIIKQKKEWTLALQTYLCYGQGQCNSAMKKLIIVYEVLITLQLHVALLLIFVIVNWLRLWYTIFDNVMQSYIFQWIGKKKSSVRGWRWRQYIESQHFCLNNHHFSDYWHHSNLLRLFIFWEFITHIYRFF